MNKTKKVFALLLAVVFVFSSFAQAFAYQPPSDVVGSDIEDIATVLGGLNVMVGDGDTGNFEGENAIKRSEFAKVAVAAIGLTDLANNSSWATHFPDVVNNHWANGFINVATTQKMVFGDSEGTFRPDDKISVAEALAIVVRMLGYEPSAQSKGGWPVGYSVVANELGLTKGISFTNSSEVKRSEVAKLVYNALEVNLMEQVNFGSEGDRFEVVDKTILKDKLEVEKKYGTVTGNYFTKLTDKSSLKKDEVQIDETIYKTNDLDAGELLGQKVVYYVNIPKGSEQNRVIVVLPDRNAMSTKEINAEDIKDVTGNVINYWEDKNNDDETREAKLADDFNFIYNMQAAEYEEDLMDIKYGHVFLIDADNDNYYDTVMAYSYENYLVDEVYESTGKIFDKNSKPVLNLNPKDDTIKYAMFKDGKEFELKNVQEWNVLSVAKSQDGKNYHILVSDKYVTGKVTEIYENIVHIDDKEYKVAEDYEGTIQLNDEGTFYLAANGKIAGFDGRIKQAANYGYLIDIVKSTPIARNADAEIFTTDGENKVIKTANKIRLNDEYALTPAQLIEKLSNHGSVTSQLISYEVNEEGQITTIFTALDNTANQNQNEKNFSKDVSASDLVYKSASGKLGKFIVNDNTIVFEIGDDPDNYAIRDKSMFKNDSSYDVDIFDLAEDLSAKVIVVKGSDSQINSEQSIAIVDTITETKNSDNQLVDKLYMYQDGKRISLLTAEKGILVKGTADEEEEEDEDEGLGARAVKALEQGDVILYNKNAKGEIDKITVLFDKDTKDTEAITNVDKDLTLVYGKIDRKFSGSINVTVNDALAGNYNTSGITIYSYDSSKADGQVSIADESDLNKYDESNPKRVLIRIYQDEVKEMVIIK